ncbi:MAG: alpha/beta fold hydrolase [Candidatus Nanopelagicales bacterium]
MRAAPAHTLLIPVAIGYTGTLILILPGVPVVTRIVLAGLVLASALATWRSNARWTLVICLAWGVVALSAAVAIGVRRAAAGDWRPWTIAGLLCLLPAVYLLGHSWRGLLDPLRRRWWLPAGIGLLVVTLLGVYVTALPLAAVAPATGALSAPAPTGWQTVSFGTADGVTLQGWYRPGQRDAAIVVVPGAGSDRSGALAQAKVLAEAGFGVLVYDPRGHGNSGGTAMDFGWAGDQDIAAAVTHVLAAGATRVGVLGLSMGGEQALGAAAADPRIQAVVAEGATGRTAADHGWLSEEYGWRGSVQEGLDAVVFAVTDALTTLPSPVTLDEGVAATAPRPVLLIAAGDRPDEVEVAQRITVAHANAREWTVPGAGHTAGLRSEPAQWRDRVVGFFNDAL